MKLGSGAKANTYLTKLPSQKSLLIKFFIHKKKFTITEDININKKYSSIFLYSNIFFENFEKVWLQTGIN